MGDLRRQVVTAAEPMVMGSGLFFKLIESTGPVLVRFDRAGATKSSDGVEAGYQYGPLPESLRFAKITIYSVTTQTIACLVGDEFEDYTRIAGLFNVVGNVSVMDIPSATLATPARVTVTTAQQLIVPANLARRRLTIQGVSTNLDSVNVGPAGQVSATRGIELQRGQTIEISTTAALYGWAVSGSQLVQPLDES